MRLENTAWFVLPTNYYEVDQIKENEVGGTCSTYEGQKRYTVFLLLNTERRIGLERPRSRCSDSIGS
jgi:hypothetical protein